MTSSSKKNEILRVDSSNLTIHGKTSVELAYLRRVCVREQRLHMILKKIEEELPLKYLKVHCIILIILILAVVSIQIILIVFKSSLYYICAGFWVGAFYILCLALVVLLGTYFLI
jgi:hypothetical protein